MRESRKCGRERQRCLHNIFLLFPPLPSFADWMRKHFPLSLPPPFFHFRLGKKKLLHVERYTTDGCVGSTCFCWGFLDREEERKVLGVCERERENCKLAILLPFSPQANTLASENKETAESPKKKKGKDFLKASEKKYFFSFENRTFVGRERTKG